MELPETRPTTLHQSGVYDLRYCPRRYYNSNVLRLEKQKVSDALRDGRALHSALEVGAGGRTLEEQRALAFRQVRVDLEAERIRPLNAVRVRAMLAGYFKRWGKLRNVWAREFPVEGPIPGVTELTFEGTIDRIVQTAGGFAILDYKTASRVDEHYLEALNRKLQGPLYAHYLEVVQGIEVVEIIYDLLVKLSPQMKPKMITVDHESEVPGSKQVKRGINAGLWRETHRENMDEFERRVQKLYLEKVEEMVLRPVLRLTRQHREDALEQLTAAAREILWRLDTGNWGENRSACEGAFYPCPYRQLCYSNYNPVVIDQHYQTKEDTCKAKAKESTGR